MYAGVGTLLEPGAAAGEPVVVMRRLPADRRLTRWCWPAHRSRTTCAGSPTSWPPSTPPRRRRPWRPRPPRLAATRARWTENAAEIAGDVTGRADLLTLGAESVLAAAERFGRGREALFAQRIDDRLGARRTR